LFVSQVGWHEHDPLEIWANVARCIEAVIQALQKKRIKFSLDAIGITNQRETTVAWNAMTGKPYYNAIVWDDTRTVHIATTLASGNLNRLREKTGLPLASYFAGTKVKWLLDNVVELQNDIRKKPKEVKFGTIDSWLLYQLSGKPSGLTGSANVGGLHLTDVSNASRWLFLDLETVQWDKGLVDTVCSPHQVPLSTLPEIRSSSEVYAICTKAGTGVDVLEGVPVACILGDQQAALVGQTAFEAGEAKNTYGTGMFLMMNTGTKMVPSAHGLLTTIAYKFNDTVYYALEGSVSHSGSTIQWLRDQLQIISKAPESEELAKKHEHNDGLYFVPAFAGLFAPHWRSDARACIVGMTATHDKGHICRAALEAACYQCKEVFDAIFEDSKVLLTSLKVDGGGTHNELMMQFQADVIRVPVMRPEVMETTAMGAAFGAGLAIGTWKDLDEIRALWSEARRFEPLMDDATRDKNLSGWKKAVSKSFGWIQDEEPQEEEEEFVDATQILDPPPTSSNRAIEGTVNPPPSSTSGFGYLSMFLMAVAGTTAGLLIGTKGRVPALKFFK